jgi:hypothetical protein
MTKLIAVAIIIVVLFCGWEYFLYWDRINTEKESAQKAAAAAENIRPESLQGVPYQLDTSLQNAYKGGAAGLHNWLKVYGSRIEDPRKAWIELDYVIAIAREDPGEAKRVYAEVRARLKPSSPVWSRVKKLETTYQ